MMRILNNTLLIIAALLMTQQVNAARYFDGQHVLEMCLVNSPETQAGCAMFIIGSAETLRMTGFSGKTYCLPEDVNNQQLAQEFIAFLQQNEQSLQYSAASIFYATLRQNHPC